MNILFRFFIVTLSLIGCFIFSWITFSSLCSMKSTTYQCKYQSYNAKIKVTVACEKCTGISALSWVLMMNT